VTRVQRPNTALSVLAQSMTGQLRFLLKGFTRNWATTQDLLQDVHVRLLTCSSVRDPASAAAFVHQTAQNIGRDWKRREQRSPVEFRPDIGELPQTDFATSPERYALARERIERLIKILPSRCQLALGLVKGEGYSYKEAAVVMNITENTIQTHLRDALLLIRRAKLQDNDL
jgi:RNA polymerase sigma factor (sigma-70 family)